MLFMNELRAWRPVSPNGCIGPGVFILLLFDLCPSHDWLQSSKGGVEAPHCSPWCSLQLQAVKAWLCHLGCHACTACLQVVPCWGTGLQLLAHLIHRLASRTLLFVCWSCCALVVRAECSWLLGSVISCGAWARESNSSFQSQNVFSTQRCHPYTGNLNSETPGDSKNVFLHCGV